MRELKFRAWDIKRKRYVSDLTVIKVLPLLIDKGITEGLAEVEQYTGLKDKNGKEIYEGDIVKNVEEINETAVCVWDESNAEFDFRCKDGKYTKDNVKSWLEMYEVIGNIHENKELLEEE